MMTTQSWPIEIETGRDPECLLVRPRCERNVIAQQLGQLRDIRRNPSRAPRPS